MHTGVLHIAADVGVDLPEDCAQAIQPHDGVVLLSAHLHFVVVRDLKENYNTFYKPKSPQLVWDVKENEKTSQNYLDFVVVWDLKENYNTFYKPKLPRPVYSLGPEGR